MDEQDDKSDVSRIPTLEDLVRICKSLNENKATYVVIGGFAVIQHGHVRGTADIDLLIQKGIENGERVKSALLVLEDRAVRDLNVEDIEKYTVVRVADEVVVDLLVQACGQTFDDLQSYIEFKKVEGVEIPFLSIEGLMKTKQGLRPKDVDDRVFLEAELLKTKTSKPRP